MREVLRGGGELTGGWLTVGRVRRQELGGKDTRVFAFRRLPSTWSPRYDRNLPIHPVRVYPGGGSSPTWSRSTRALRGCGPTPTQTRQKNAEGRREREPEAGVPPLVVVVKVGATAQDENPSPPGAQTPGQTMTNHATTDPTTDWQVVSRTGRAAGPRRRRRDAGHSTERGGSRKSQAKPRV